MPSRSADFDSHLTFPSDSHVRCVDDNDWAALLHAAPVSDVYYRAGYVRAHEKAGHGHAIAVAVSAGDSRFLVPLLLRPLSELSFAPGFRGYDAITAYGYGGVLRLSGPQEVTPETGQALCDALRRWCFEVGIVCALIRLNPLLGQEEWFTSGIEGFTLRPFGPTIALDVQQWNAEHAMVASMNGKRRHDLRKARQHLTMSWASEQGEITGDSLQLFRALYEERMDRLRADKAYYFPTEYYTELLRGLHGQADIAFAWLAGKAVGAALFLTDRDFAHYHLAGANDLGRTHHAMTLLVNGGAEWARRSGCRWLHLGGGRRAGDQLFQFKKSFGGSIFQYSFANFVTNPAVYDELVALRQQAPNLGAPRQEFFPEYRA